MLGGAWALVDAALMILKSCDRIVTVVISTSDNQKLVDPVGRFLSRLGIRGLRDHDAQAYLAGFAILAASA
jgi:hypothetical protein